MTTVEKEQIQQWVESWKIAGAELRKIKMAELAAMTDEEARSAIESLLSSLFTRTAYKNPKFDQYSGLIEQQKYFQRLRHENF